MCLTVKPGTKDRTDQLNTHFAYTLGIIRIEWDFLSTFLLDRAASASGVYVWMVKLSALVPRIAGEHVK